MMQESSSSRSVSPEPLLLQGCTGWGQQDPPSESASKAQSQGDPQSLGLAEVSP